MDCCPNQIRVNRYFHEMGVQYGLWDVPPEPVRRQHKRGRGARGLAMAAKVSDEPTVKKGKKASVSAAGGQAAKMTVGKPLRAPVSKVFVSKAEAANSKGIYPCGYTFKIAEQDMGSRAFMKELRATEWSVPWSLGSRDGRLKLILSNLALCVQTQVALDQ